MSITEHTSRRTVDAAPISWGLVAAATVLAAGTAALIWLAAVPWGPVVCPAIYPAPRNCFSSDRAGTALVVTAIVLVVYLATLAAALVGRRQRGYVIAGVVLLALSPLVSYLAVAYVPGFPL